jgi:hypothetical protein
MVVAADVVPAVRRARFLLEGAQAMSEGPYKPTGYEAPGTHAVECPDGHVIYTDKARYWAGELNAAFAAGAASRPASDDLMRAVEALEREWTPQHIAKTPLDAAVVNVILALRHSARPAPDVDATRAMVNQEVAAAIIREAIEKARNA